MSVAIFASIQFGAIPMEHVRKGPIRRATVALICRATDRAFSRGAKVSVSSHSTSSIERTSETWMHASMASSSRWWMSM